MPSDVLCCQQESPHQMHSLDLRPDRSFLELPMKLLYSGLCEFYDSFDKVVPWHQQGMSWHIRVHGHTPLTTLQWVRSHSDQGHTFQDHALEVHDAVDFYWLLTWWLSSVRSSHLSRYKRISCESHVYSPKNQNQNPDWQVTPEQLQDISEVMIQRWQMVVMYGALMEEMVSFLESRIELIWTEATTHDCQLLQNVKCYMVDYICSLGLKAPDTSVTVACTTVGIHMLTPQNSLSWLAAKVQVYPMFSMSVFICFVSSCPF